MNSKKLYVLSVANATTGHRFSDDVAICWAASKEEAAERFSKMYLYEDIE